MGVRYAEARRDVYGGCTGIQFEATGYFRLEHADRWWLVTPEGNAYLSFGLNHVHLRNMQCPYNREHWAKALGVPVDAPDAAWQAGFEAKARADFKALGATTLGTHSPTTGYQSAFANDVVNVRMVDICHYQTPSEDEFYDVYDDAFRQHCEGRARELVAPRSEDPRVIGYSLTDCPILTEPESWPHIYNIYGWERPQVPTWPRVLRNKGEESAGKRAYVNAMRDIYAGDIATFNKTYGTAFASFDALQRARNWRHRIELDNQREARDNAQFLLQVVDQCYSVECAAIRKYDSNHLILGDKFQGNRMGLPVPTEHIALAAKHFDVLFYQKYGVWADQEPLLDLFGEHGGGKPVYMGDSSINVAKENLPDPFGPRCVNQDLRAEAFREVFYRCFARQDFIGWDWCGWMDLWVDDPTDLQARDPRHAGIQDPFGAFDQPIARAMKQFSDEMYDVATGGVSL